MLGVMTHKSHPYANMLDLAILKLVKQDVMQQASGILILNLTQHFNINSIVIIL